MEDVLTRPAYWLATVVPLFATTATVLATRAISKLWRGVLVAVTYIASLPVGFVLVLMAIDRGPEMRRAVDGIAAIPMMLVWIVAPVVIGGAIWFSELLAKPRA